MRKLFDAKDTLRLILLARASVTATPIDRFSSVRPARFQGGRNVRLDA